MCMEKLLFIANICKYYLMLYHRYANIEHGVEVDERIPEDLFIKLMIEKANIIKDHLKISLNQLIIVANIGPTMAVFKLYDLKEEEDSLKLHITLSNLCDIDEQIHQLWQQVSFLLQQYCSQCQSHNFDENKIPDIE